MRTEKENNILLENYTHRENLRIMNLPEAEDHNVDTRYLTSDILQHELNLDVTNNRLHAAHRIRRPQATKRRPIIVRFLCREDRYLVFRSKKTLRVSAQFNDVYITADYARAIQEERRELVKAMFTAK